MNLRQEKLKPTNNKPCRPINIINQSTLNNIVIFANLDYDNVFIFI